MPPGRIPSCTYEDVAHVCEDLDERGALTLDNVRTELGRGSKTTLLVHYQQWRAQRVERSRAPDTAELPPKLRAAWADEMAAVRAAVAEGLRAELEELRRQLTFAQDHLKEGELRHEALQGEIDAARAEAAADKADRETQFAEWRGKLAESDKQVESLREQLEREQLGAERARIAEAEANIRSEAAQAAITTLGDENKEMRQGLETARAQVAQSQQDAAVARAHLSDRDASVQALGAELAEGRKEMATLRQSHEDTLKRLETAERRADVCGVKSEGLQGEIARRAADLETTRSETMSLRQELATLREQHDGALRRLSTAELRAETGDARCEDLRQQLERLTTERPLPAKTRQ